jgi:Flp pilus assembly protein TadD
MNNKILYLQKEFQTLTNLFKTNEYILAISRVKKLLKKFKNNSTLINFLGCCYQQLGKFEEAKFNFITALQFDSNNIPAMNNLANTHKSLKEYTEAEDCYKKIIEKQPNYLNALVNYANMKRHFNDLDGAIYLLEKAAIISSNNRSVIYNLALVQQAQGNFSGANESAKKLLKISPNDTEADKILSVGNKYNKDDEHFIDMQKKILNKDLGDNQKIYLHFSLSKSFEDILDYEKSFTHMELGNKIKRKSIVYNIEDEVKLFKNIKSKFQNFNFENFKNNNDNENKLIFIIGMPRSGTTLVHQIISAHEKVYGAGEVDYLGYKIINQFFKRDNLLNDEISDNLTSELQEVKHAYLKYLKYFNSKEQYLVDKSPLNFMWIGFIKLIFPKSKVILCNRDANDTCLSLYKNLFTDLNWCYSENELAIFYNLYQNIMLFWKDKIPNFICDVEYESLIKNTKVEIQKIINFCELPSDENCFNFHKNKTPIKTSSILQSRKPVYSSSVKLSDKYSNKLKNLFEQIKKNGP